LTESWSGSFCWRFGGGLFGFEAANFGKRAPDYAVALGAGTVDRGLGAEEVVIEHGVVAGFFGEGHFDFGAAAESPGGSGDFGREEFLKRAFGTHVVPEGDHEGFIFFGFVRPDAVACGVEA
jgi:hypothetical protein